MSVPLMTFDEIVQAIRGIEGPIIHPETVELIHRVTTERDATIKDLRESAERIAADRMDKVQKLQAEADWLRSIASDFFDAAGGSRVFGAFEPGRDPYKLAIAAVKEAVGRGIPHAQLLAFASFREERAYQDLKHGALGDKKQTASGFMLCMEGALQKAKVGWLHEDAAKLMSEIVQVGAVATAMLEQFGVPPGRSPMEMDRAHRRAERRLSNGTPVTEANRE